jgi:hypothetical protein
MSTGDPPGFRTVLPLVALLGLLGGSLALTYAVRALAVERNRTMPVSNGIFVAVSATLYLAVFVATALGFAVGGGLPMGPLFAFGQPLLTLLVVYGIPLAVGARLFALFCARNTGEPEALRSKRLSGALFAVGHVATAIAVWGLFVLVG